jgi:PIN domain nuclease of toxin-antitoxin system
VIHLDTHVVVWLFVQEHDRLPTWARRRLEEDDVAISPMVELELTYLREIGRLRCAPADVLSALSSALGMTVSASPFPAVVGHAMALSWTRDPFDRLIVAHALADRVPLLTADEAIRANCDSAVWDKPPAGAAPRR